MRLLWFLIGACALCPLDSHGQGLSTIISFILNTLEQQLKIARQRRGIELIVPEPPPSLVQFCQIAKMESCQDHLVYTADGYILKLLHIPSATAGAVPVLLMHGNFATSDGYLLRNEKSMAAVFQKAGYDVWLGNWRGSTHSRRHLRLNWTDPSFYDYSIHELGVYDMPALIDYVLQRTGQANLHLYGHSMGCPAILAGLASRPDYNVKVRFVGLLAPVIWPRGVLEVLAKLLLDTFRHEMREFMKITSAWNLLPRSGLIHYVGDTFCRDDSLTIDFCRQGFELVFGTTHPSQRLKDFLPQLSATHPAGSSYNINMQYYEMISSGRFRPLRRGGRDSPPPPDYNLTAITAPVGLYYGATDFAMSVKDMGRLSRALPSLVESYLVPMDVFSHFDFFAATDARGLIWDRLIQTMKNIDSRMSLNLHHLARV